MESCTQIDKCDVNTTYLNLPSVYLNTFSCFSCDDNNIPFIGLEIDTTTYNVIGLKPFQLVTQDFVNINGEDLNPNISCLNPTLSTNFGIPVDQNQTFPANCGLGVINLSSSDGDYSDSVNV